MKLSPGFYNIGSKSDSLQKNLEEKRKKEHDNLVQSGKLRIIKVEDLSPYERKLYGFEV